MKNTEKETSLPDVVILGSTGSVGTQALDIARFHSLRVDAMCAGRNVAAAEAQIREFAPRMFAMADEAAAADLKLRVADTRTVILSGEEGICRMAEESDAPIVLNAILGEAGLRSTLTTLRMGKQLALANKESLVIAGDIVMALAREKGIKILPVDSEHCAIDQCLRAGRREDVKKLILTASGGPFFGRSTDELKNITVKETLAHPTWKMGAKITVDSATLMNKGFEVIEAVHLFGVTPDQVEVLIQRESIIHSMVEYADNSIIAQLSVPDMRLCVQYALTSPERVTSPLRELDFAALSGLTFARPDTDTFVLLPCAIRAIRAGGALPAVVNAANEVTVARFLQGGMPFTAIADVVCDVTERLSRTAPAAHALADILAFDREARALAEEKLEKF